MKINKVYENKEYYKELGYTDAISSYLSYAYQLWTDAEGLEQLSADEHDPDKLTTTQNEFLSAFMKLWNIVDEFEYIYNDDNWHLKRINKKYNL